MKDVFKNKRLWIGIGCGILAVVLVVGIILMAGGNGDKNPNPANPSITAPSGNVTEPNVTEPNVTEPNVTEPNGTEPEVTDPSHNDDPEVPTSPTVPEQPTGPAVPSDPVIEPTIPDEDPTLPTDPDGDPILPTDPDTGEEIPVGPPDRPSETFPKDEKYDFNGVTVGTIRATDWNSWDNGKKQAFLDSIDWNRVTPEERHNWELAHRYNDYDCGFKGHACRDDLHHESVMAGINAGCDYCGKHDCPSLLTVNPADLFTEPDPTACPEYDTTKDPMEYCQICKRPVNGKPGEKCSIFQTDGPCPYCGAWKKAWTCHCCNPDDLD